ncbi:MAG: DUF4139 domain-containing protein [Planctomycetota bacterium]|jgi:hypothetical protein
MKTQILTYLTACLLLSSLGLGAEAEPGVAITVYNDNFAVVKENRSMAFDKGVNTFKFTDVAERIDPTSVNFLCVTAPDAVSILEQNYEYDLVNTSSLLKRYIDKPVQLLVKGSGASGQSFVSGVLRASAGNDLIVDVDGDMTIISKNAVGRISLSEKPKDLVTKPTLVWLVDSEAKGDQLCRVTYTTDGIGWKADYSAVLSDDEKTLDLSGWVTIDNKSGGAYKDAAIKLIAGDVNRIQPSRGRPEMMMMDGARRAKAAAPAFEEKAFMEYHLYTLGRKSTVLNNQVKQIELITPAHDVPVEKKYITEVSVNDWQVRQHKDKVQVKIEFENKKEYQLGIALPKGKVRVFKKDPADGTLEFVGEDQIDHTPRKEKLSLYIGDAFDIVPEQKLTDSKRGDRFFEFTRQVEIRNRKDEAVTVNVDELVPYHCNWTVRNQSHDYEKKDASTARFAVEVKADSTATLVYSMTQTW